MQVSIQQEWQKALQAEFAAPYFAGLVSSVKQEYTKGPVFPLPKDIFRAFDLTPLSKVKVVILGQDPYHTPGVADGLAFSTKPGNKVPPSLRNIFKEIARQYPDSAPASERSPDLTNWAKQGVLLLNNTLTVRSGQANSHAKLGWDTFTDAVIDVVASTQQGVVFILWGKFAQGKEQRINDAGAGRDHLILKSAHPSPFSAERGFFGNDHFKLTNEYLLAQSKEPINW